VEPGASNNPTAFGKTFVDRHASYLVRRVRFRYALKVVRFLQILLVVLLCSIPATRAQEVPASSRPLMAQAAESRLVWVNTATGIYHYPDTRWYGKTKQGKFMSEAEARAQGYRRLETGSDGWRQMNRTDS
jgi:hypothetical protein